MINEFKGIYTFLSNFHPLSEKIIDDMKIKYPTVEHYFQAQKTLDEQERIKIAFIPKNQADRAKRQGKKLKLRKDWEEIKIDIMEHGLRQKFSPGYLRMRLLLTKPHKLIESNYWHDNFWGACSCPKCKNIPSQNHLGKLLMKIRDSI